MERKIEQIAAVNQKIDGGNGSNENQLMVVARCNDGSIWTIPADEFKPYWTQLPDIPQTDVKGDCQ